MISNEKPESVHVPVKIPISTDLSNYDRELIAKFKDELRRITDIIHLGLLKRGELNSDILVDRVEFDKDLKSLFLRFDYDSVCSTADYSIQIEEKIAVFFSKYHITTSEKVSRQSPPNYSSIRLSTKFMSRLRDC